MEKEKKAKKGNKIKILAIILLMILISMIGFVGIYTQKQNRMENIIKDYDLAMDLNGSRVVGIKPSESMVTVIKDAEGNVIEEELTDEQITEKGYTKEEVDENADKKTKENFEKVKSILENRLDQTGVENYILRLDEQTGEITIEVEENTETDTIISNLYTTGKFEIVDSQTNEVLMTNADIQEVNVMYGSETSGTSVYLEIVFNKEGKTKIENISNTYATIEENTTTNETTENTTNESAEENTTENTTEEETESTESEQKEITMRIDDQDIMTTSFSEPIITGKLELSVGSASTSSETINTNIDRAQSIATILDNGNLPMDYEVIGNEYIKSDVESKEIQKVIIGAIIVAVAAYICLIIKYKTNALLTTFTSVGFMAIFLMLIRYANVMISLEGIFGIAIVAIINYILIIKLLSNINKEDINKTMQKTYTDFILKIMPICIMAIVFCFMQWIPIVSFGMTMFWGIILMVVYNWIVTIPALKIKQRK